MQRLFKRKKRYYFRVKIVNELQKYFDNKEVYIRSLKTNNINDAKLIVKFLSAKLNYIQSGYMQLSTSQIKQYIDEFKKIHFEDILNRNSYLSVEQIDKTIETLNTDVYIYDEIIKAEMYDLMQLLNSSYEISSEIDLDIADIEMFKKYIIQIKINALNEVKKDIKNTIVKTTQNSTLNYSYEENTTILIKEAVDDYIASKTGVSDKVSESIKRNLDKFITYCDNNSIYDVAKLKHKDLINFRTKYMKQNPKAKPSSVNMTMGIISTFIKYCVKVDYLLKDISKDIRLKLTIKEQIDKKRASYTDDNIKTIFENIDLIKYSSKLKTPRKYIDEYELIILIAMYTGTRENEICQLTTDDIKEQDNIYYFDFNLNDDKKLKNISSIRKVPIHSKLLPKVLAYIKTLKRKNLFTIASAQFSIDYGKFKKELGFSSKLVFHSFRNTLQNKLKQQKIENMIINEITGHAHGTAEKMTDQYTDKYDLKILLEAIEVVGYEYE